MRLADVRTENRSSLTFFETQIAESDVVLDVGTKNGEKVTEFAGTVLGIDIASSAFDLNKDIEFLCGDATHLPIRSNTVDYVHCDQVLEHVEDTGMLLAEIARVLKPDGLAYVGFPNRFSWRRPHSEVPRYYSLLPRQIGSLLSRFLLDDAGEAYFEESLFPISPLAARYHLHRHFDDVIYPMRLDPSSVTSSATLRRLIWGANSLAARRPFCWMGEILWPAASYLCADPIEG